jgi:hypothetical protein
MAKKKGRKQGGRSTSKKTISAGGKKGRSAAGKKSAAPVKKGTPAVAKKGAAGLVPTRHRRLRIGMSSKNSVPVFRTGQDNTFMVFGHMIGTGSPNNKTVYLDATDHTWVNPPTRVRNSGRDALEITATCNVRIPARKDYDTDDDLTVTIILDENTPNQDTTDCYFDEVDYDA